MIIDQTPQGTPEWLALRRGKITGTRLKEVMGTANAKLALTAELIAEEGAYSDVEMKEMLHKATQVAQEAVIADTQIVEEEVVFQSANKDNTKSAAMKRGNEKEPEAIALFERQTGKKVTSTGLCIHDKHNWLALSPDGFIADEHGVFTEGIEVKSPNSKTAILYKLVNMIDNKELGITPAKKSVLEVPPEYIWQCVHYFIVNEDLKKLHFGVYDDRFKDDKNKLTMVVLDRENEELQDLISKATVALLVFRTNWLKWKEVVV